MAARAPNSGGEAVTDLHPYPPGWAISSTVCFTASTDSGTEFSAGRVRETGFLKRAGCPRRSWWI